MGCTGAKNKFHINNKINIIWVDPNVDNPENSNYLDELKLLGLNKINTFKAVENSITYIKGIKFEETFVILSGKIYIEFIEKFKENLKNMCNTKNDNFSKTQR